jgi:hypothetical protein
MAQSYVDPIGGELYIPAAYPSITVAPNNGGLSTTGVMVLMGEAESGPAYSEETELGDNLFAADDISSIVAKYGSGPLVDAAKAAASAAVDPDITIPFSRLIPVKTNTGVKASSALLQLNSGSAYTSLRAKAAGAGGNLIFYSTTAATTEVAPTTSLVTIVPPAATISYTRREDGDTELAGTITGDALPAAIVTALNGLADTTTRFIASGGAENTGAIPAGTPNLTLTVATPSLKVGVFLLSVAWVSVVVGSTLEIPVGSGFAGAGANIGWWVVTAVNGNTLTATKIGDKSTTTGHAAGSVVNPASVSLTAVNVTHGTDLKIHGPVTLAHNAAAVSGIGKTMEFAAASALTGDTDLRNVFRLLGTATVTPWVAVNGTPAILTSATEGSITMAVTRKSDNINETFTAGGEIGLKVGYQGYSCTIVTNSTGITVTYKALVGDTATVLTMLYTAYPTIADVAAYLGSITGFSVAAGTAVLGNLPSSALDDNTWGVFSSSYNAATTWGGYACRIKIDAYRLRSALAGSYLVEFATAPQGGLPALVSTSTFLANGAKGGTTAAGVSLAIDAMEQLRANFIVPCFSQDATADIAAGLTDASSTYTIDAINSLIKTHVHKMSGMKTKRNRQAFVSKRGTFDAVKEAAANLASHRCMMAFEDVKSSVSGSIVQYQPYMAAALAASMQAGAFYKSIVRKQVNITGALQAAGDWTYNLDSKLEDALRAGLNPIRKAEEGGFVWVSDQTTYGKDNKNFYNSIQMVYAGDIVALTTAQRMERAFVGQSVADVSAAVAVSYLDSIMADFLRLKLIAPSSDAPLGYKNAKVVIEGSTMRVSVEVKIAGSIYFIPIAFYVTEITQSA